MNSMEWCQQDLEAAWSACRKATNSRGLYILLVRYPYNLEAVRKQLHAMMSWFDPDCVHLSGQEFGGSASEGAEIANARNLALVANLYHHLLRYRAYQEATTSTERREPPMDAHS